MKANRRMLAIFAGGLGALALFAVPVETSSPVSAPPGNPIANPDVLPTTPSVGSPPIPTPASAAAAADELDPDKKVSLAVDKILSDPTVFNVFITKFINSGWNSSDTNAVLSLLKELHLRPVVFHATGGSDAGVFGIEYDFNKSLQNKTLNADSINPLGLSLNAHAKGTIAQSASKNPNNFLESGFDLHLFQALGGMTPNFVKNVDELRVRDQARKAATLIKLKPGEKIQDNPAFQETGRTVMQYCRPQFSYDLSAHATLESDQTFSKKQWAYGGEVSLVYEDWQDSSPYNWLNVADIPFAFLRSFTTEGRALNLKPSGLAFPVVIGGIDLVDPSGNSTRFSVDAEKSAYPRVRAEVGFKTQVARLLGTDLWFSANYRYFHEVNASSAIRASRLDDFHYFVARLDLPKGFNVSYSTGKLPLDRKSDQIYALGYAINF